MRDRAKSFKAPPRGQSDRRSDLEEFFDGRARPGFNVNFSNLRDPIVNTTNLDKYVSTYDQLRTYF